MQNVNMLLKGAVWPQHTAMGTSWVSLAAGRSQPLAAPDPAAAESRAQVGWDLVKFGIKVSSWIAFLFSPAFWVLVEECVLRQGENCWAALVGCGWRGKRLKGLLNEWKHLKSPWLRAEYEAEGWVRARSELSEGLRLQVPQSAVKDALNREREDLELQRRSYLRRNSLSCGLEHGSGVAHIYTGF